MVSRMMRTVNATDNQYLSPAQQKELLDYAKSLPRRFAAARAVEETEARIVDLALEKFEEAQPTVGDLAELGWATAGHDLRLALRAIVGEMLMDDDAVAELKVLGHLRRTFGYLDLPADAGRDLFAGLLEAARDTLPPDAFDALSPHLERAVERTAGEPVAA